MTKQEKAHDRWVAKYRKFLAEYGIDDPRTQALLIHGDARINAAELLRRITQYGAIPPVTDFPANYPYPPISERDYQTTAERAASREKGA